MTSIVKTIVWEFYRENRWWWLCLATAFSSLAVLIGVLGDFPKQTPALPPVGLLALMLIEIFFVTYFLLMKQYNVNTHRLGFPLHLYTKPVRTTYLVLIRLSLVLLLTVLSHLFVVLVFKGAVNVTIPFVKPALLLGLTVTGVHAFIWLLPNIQWLQTLCAGIALLPYISLLAYWSDISRLAFDENKTNALMNRVSLFWTGLGILAAYLLAWIAVILDRRQLSLNPAVWLNDMCRKSSPPTTPPLRQRPASPFGMLYRFELQRKGWQWPLANACGFLILLVFWLCRLMPIDIFGGFIHLGLVINVLVFPILIGFVLGQHGKGHLFIETYKAVKPVTNHQFLGVYLLAGLTSLALAWLVFVIGPALLHLFFLATDRAKDLEEFWKSFPPMNAENFGGIPSMLQVFLVSDLTVWTTLTLAATLMLAGRRWLAISVWLGIWILPMVLGIFVQLFPNPVRDVVSQIVLSSVGLCLLASVLGFFIRAAIQKQIKLPTVTLSILIYLGLIFVFLPTIPTGQEALPMQLLVAGGLALPLLPFASAPLALAWNRHR